jgi:hypothetical protein
VLRQYIHNYFTNVAGDEAMHLLVGNKSYMISKKTVKAGDESGSMSTVDSFN